MIIFWRNLLSCVVFCRSNWALRRQGETWHMQSGRARKESMWWVSKVKTWRKLWKHFKISLTTQIRAESLEQWILKRLTDWQLRIWWQIYQCWDADLEAIHQKWVHVSPPVAITYISTYIYIYQLSSSKLYIWNKLYLYSWGKDTKLFLRLEWQYFQAPQLVILSTEMYLQSQSFQAISGVTLPSTSFRRSIHPLQGKMWQ